MDTATSTRLRLIDFGLSLLRSDLMAFRQPDTVSCLLVDQIDLSQLKLHSR
jgi:hypothetical protein